VTGSPALPLRACGRWIVDATGRRFKLAGVNWYGASDAKYVVGGLDQQPVSSIAATIRGMGFNMVRLPFSNEMVEKNPMVDRAAIAKNPQLYGMRALDVLDAVIDALAAEGVVVVLDNHTSHARWCCCDTDGDGLWYTPDYPESAWIRDWVSLVQRYQRQPAVVGVDLRNEPRATTPLGPLGRGATWGPGDARLPTTDWRAAAIRGASAVLTANPNLLVLVDGVDFATDLHGAHDDPIHDDPMGIGTLPLQLLVPGRLGYSSHNYAGTVSFSTAAGCYTSTYASMDHDTLFRCAGSDWGYLVTQWQSYTAPLWVSEFGDGGVSPWFSNLVDYLRATDFDWAYWPLNVGPKPDGDGQVCPYASGDETFGLLEADWSGPLQNDARITALQSIQRATQGPGVRPDDACPAYGTATFHFSDQDRSGGAAGDWDPGAYKGTCARDERVVGLGLSGPSTARFTDRALCSTERFAVTPSTAFETVVSVDGHDTPHAGSHTAGQDWAPGITKLECDVGEYVAGVSQTAQALQYAAHGLLCRRAATSLGLDCESGAGAPNVRSLDHDDRGDDQPPVDWDVAAFKAQCAADEYIAAVSVSYSPTQGVPRSVLCCKVRPGRR
jgi:endoglucanase